MTQELKHDIKKIDIGLNMTDWAKYATKPEEEDEVAMGRPSSVAFSTSPAPRKRRLQPRLKS